ncbi:MAG: hypothetical protein QNL33_14230 [Akkermansiaceae bacterium]|jgi:hypothetical protein
MAKKEESNRVNGIIPQTRAFPGALRVTENEPYGSEGDHLNIALQLKFS